MESKKKNFLEKLRLKTKLPNLKKSGKKTAGKQGKKLAYRRSISVPDLRIVPSQAFSADTPTSDAIFFGTSSGQSDTDSVASCSSTSGPHFRDNQTHLVPEIRHRNFRNFSDNAALASNRMSAPVETLILNEEKEDVIDAQVGKRFNVARGNIPTMAFTPDPAPRSDITNTEVSAPRLNLVDKEILSAERIRTSEDTTADTAVPGAIDAALPRAYSFGDQVNLRQEKKTISFGQKQSSSEKGTPPVLRANATADRLSLNVDSVGTGESADGISLDSTGGTSSEERVNMPWTIDSEDLDREPLSPFMHEIFSMEEPQLEEAQLGGGQEETVELSNEPSDHFDDFTPDLSESSETMAVGSGVQAAVPFQRYLLNINLREGKNLVIRDKRSSKSDPYVKFKLEGKQFYKSKVVYKNLNPRWNEAFSHPLRDREHNVEVRVYNKNRTSDDFMGSSSISLEKLELYKTYQMELCLDDPKRKEDDMGVIVVDVCLMFRDATIKRSPRWPAKKNKEPPWCCLPVSGRLSRQQNQAQAVTPQRTAEIQKNQLKNQLWTGVLGIALVEGQDLPQYGLGDIYVRFRLGDQKYKSKSLCIQTNPQWREQFDFNQFEDQEPLQVEVFSKRGRKGEESWGMFEIDLSRLPLNERQLYTNVLDPGKGRLVFVITLRPCWGVAISDIQTAPLEQPDERDTIVEKFSLKNSHKRMREVGFLQVKVIKATDLPISDLNGKSNPFCVIELGNSKLQTQTVYKNLSPEWNKAFTFPVKDIHDVLELTVLDENGDKAPTFLGKVAIPLLTVQNGKQVSFFLKKEELGSLSKGTITLVMEVIYNKIRAGVRTFQPKETKLMEENLKFNKKILAQNICRVRKISTAVLYTLQYIKSCFQWESTQRSLIAFLIFLVTVWHCELFMLPLFLLLFIMWNYFQYASGRTSSNQDLVNMGLADDEEDDEKESGKKGLMDKIHMVQEVVMTVQNILDEIASIGEQIKNIFNWSVPFMSCLACLVLFTATTILYCIPLRYLVLIWGVNKFTKKLRNPYTIDNNKILDFLKRVPSDVQKVQYSTVRAPTSQSQPRKRK
ncbi:hypothetical protein LDENG_00018640 [Lucifuga dentata]|nr:hypothetical protein LDENG_00018640 [Lucifuga dentata]